MKIDISRQFAKDVRHYNIEKRIALLIDKVKKAKGLSEISNCKKMKGYKEAWRIRLGSYRIGIVYDKNEVLIFKRVLLRKDIYKYFP